MSSNVKWPCTACSYANWPLARKCVLCLTPKDPAVVESGKTKVEVIQPKDDKWSCKICTYDNWPASTRCTMCQEDRNPAEQSQQSGATGPAAAESLGAGASGGQSGPKNRRKKSKGAEAPSSREKWQCPVCTYSNFTKTKKCIMCGIAPTPALLRQLSNSSSSSNDSKGSREELTREPCKRVDLREGCKRAEARVETPRARTENRREVKRTVYDSDSKKQMRNRVLQEDWLFLNACIGAIEGDPVPVERYISQGGLLSRALTADESRMLTKDTLNIDQGLTLPHLALKYSHSVARLLLSSQQARSPQPTLKRMPSYESPCTAREIRRLVAGNIRQCTGEFQCYYVCDPVTFVLPSEIQTMSGSTQHQLYNDILDRDVEKVLEENDIINWSREIMVKFRSRLHALWNRSAGDCLLDSALQATWGVNDRDGCLRRALSSSLKDAAEIFYPRWKEYEQMTAANMHYSLDESQWAAGWKKIVKLAEQPGSSLEQSHIFGLAHVLRRPIIVYGVKYVHNYTGEPLDFARFEGIYLPLLWDQSFCTKSPIVLGYTRGHFSALVASQSGMDQTIVLPLVDSQHQLLPVHFLTQIELGQEEELVTEWLDTMTTSSGILIAKQYLTSQHILSQHLIDEWLLKYRARPESSTL